MKRRWLLAGSVALAGCSVLPSQPYLHHRDWPLDVQRPEALPPHPRGPVLLVRSVRASPELAARGLQWLQRDGSVHIDYYEQWAVPPAQGVEDDLRQWLAASGLFSAVLAPGSRLNTQLVLEGELQQFTADLNAGVARVALALVLLDERPSPVKVLLQKTERAEAKLAGTDPASIAAALKAALVDVLQRTETDLAAVVRR